MRPETSGDSHQSSRHSAAGAGWGCQRPGIFVDLLPAETSRFSWLRPSVLWESRNDIIARWFGDPTDDVRRRWVADRLARGVDASFTIHRPDETFSFLVLGDTGEGDRSQYAVVPGALKIGDGTDFMLIASDVIYPVGSVNDYPKKFYCAYQDYPGPIYAVPGNHDWYDGLSGFMRVFCGGPVEPQPPGPWKGAFSWLARWLWRPPAKADEAALAAGARLRDQPAQRATQPGPYWAIDTPSLRIVGIDTGITGDIDRAQGEWLRQVSAGPKPKLLITGKPLYVDDEHHRGPIEGGGFVDDIVADPACAYVAAIGGDIHNYQHYPVKVGDRTIQYIVSGGGGAFMHATHTIPRTTLIEESTFKCYPLRGDSLAFYSRLYGRRLHLRRFFELTPEQAAAVIARRLKTEPTRTQSKGLRPSRRARIVASLLGVPGGGPWWFRLPVRRAYDRLFSSASDSDVPPFFKNFLRLDVSPGELRIRCYAATGCHEHELDPPLEDEIVIPLVPPSAPAG
jgi:Calcineurin-like phosphoesterase